MPRVLVPSFHYGRRHARAVRVALIVALAAPFWAASAFAEAVAIPLRIDHEAIAAELRFALFTGSGATMKLVDGSGCNVVVLSEPRTSARDGRLVATATSKASLGAPAFGTCLSGGTWSGFVEVVEQPSIAPDRRGLRFRVVDSALRNEQGEPGLSGTVWGWVKELVHPRFEAFELDLGPQIDGVRTLLPGVLAEPDRAWLERVTGSLAIDTVRTSEAGLEVGARIDVPPRPGAPPAPSGPEQALSRDELAVWTEQWKAWDAFITFTVKQAFEDAAARRDVGDALSAVLMDARHELDRALVGPRPASGEDRVRALFLRTWEDLAPRLRALATERDEAGLARYLAFLAAGDALAALDAAGPRIGLEVSTDGLRRLARTLTPDLRDEDLVWSEDVDPAFRTLVGLGEPLAPPSRPRPEEIVPTAPAAPAAPPPILSSDDSPRPPRAQRPAPPERPTAPPEQKVPAPAPPRAPPTTAALVTPPARPGAARSLDAWAPSRADLDAYLPRVRDLLVSTADDVLEGSELAPRYHELYRAAVLATAWKESCWRQYVVRGSKVVPLDSGIGAVGIMQINKRVWRGAYDVGSLDWSIGYNAEAGAEILMHYLRDYALKKGEHEQPGGDENLVRSAYSIYNGGPRHRTRYRDPTTRASLREIDAGFLERYRAVRAGRALDVRSCY